ncbi:hypothetical protein P7K49_001731 [Saguinus oedipus]|uniref:Uncharacterized protein n=1 Tax=Saguinus oedipus TaxID=9490 RepID=A0ABQ9WFX3_SAGOE|nr:hypothetical protein P7K49_001731 [Saguinus oedipus]
MGDVLSTHLDDARRQHIAGEGCVAPRAPGVPPETPDHAPTPVRAGAVGSGESGRAGGSRRGACPGSSSFPLSLGAPSRALVGSTFLGSRGLGAPYLLEPLGSPGLADPQPTTLGRAGTGVSGCRPPLTVPAQKGSKPIRYPLWNLPDPASTRSSSSPAVLSPSPRGPSPGTRGGGFLRTGQ